MGPFWKVFEIGRCGHPVSGDVGFGFGCYSLFFDLASRCWGLLALALSMSLTFAMVSAFWVVLLSRLQQKTF